MGFRHGGWLERMWRLVSVVAFESISKRIFFNVSSRSNWRFHSSLPSVVWSIVFVSSDETSQLDWQSLNVCSDLGTRKDNHRHRDRSLECPRGLARTIWATDDRFHSNEREEIDWRVHEVEHTRSASHRHRSSAVGRGPVLDHRSCQTQIQSIRPNSDDERCCCCSRWSEAKTRHKLNMQEEEWQNSSCLTREWNVVQLRLTVTSDNR